MAVRTWQKKVYVFFPYDNLILNEGQVKTTETACCVHCKWKSSLRCKLKVVDLEIF